MPPSAASRLRHPLPPGGHHQRHAAPRGQRDVVAQLILQGGRAAQALCRHVRCQVEFEVSQQGGQHDLQLKHRQGTPDAIPGAVYGGVDVRVEVRGREQEVGEDAVGGPACGDYKIKGGAVGSRSGGLMAPPSPCHLARCTTS